MALVQEIVAELRSKILNGVLTPGEQLPSVRAMSEQLGCAPGTVQRAYRELARAGLVSAHVGQGTHVTAHPEVYTPLRRATLVNKLETHLLGLFASGYTPQEVDAAVREVLERWQAHVEAPPPPVPPHVIRFVGSHDPSISLIAHRFRELAPGNMLETTFTGSVGGLMALARSEADVAGCHLWDEETDTYNKSMIQQLLPGRQVALVALALRHLGLIVLRGNPQQIGALTDLVQPGVRFVNRQWGTGTRLWLDTQLAHLAIKPEEITGYEHEVATHLGVAGCVAEKRADVGLGVEAAALAYGLDFVLLTTEQYDLVIPREVWELQAIQALVEWMASDEARSLIANLGGYDTIRTGDVEWID